MSGQRPRHVIKYEGRQFENEYVFPAEVAALRARRTGQFQELPVLNYLKRRALEGIYFDVGAHIGNHTLFFAVYCPSITVIAIEAHPTIFEILERNIYRNLPGPNGRKVELFNRAAWSNSEEAIRMAEIPRNNAGHTQIVGFGDTPPDANVSSTVSSMALDDLRLTKVGRCAVLKIDVEDAEDQVLLGAQDIIANDFPLIIIERHTKQQLNDSLELLSDITDETGKRYRVVEYWQGIHTYALEAH